MAALVCCRHSKPFVIFVILPQYLIPHHEKNLYLHCYGNFHRFNNQPPPTPFATTIVQAAVDVHDLPGPHSLDGSERRLLPTGSRARLPCLFNSSHIFFARTKHLEPEINNPPNLLQSNCQNCVTGTKSI